MITTIPYNLEHERMRFSRHFSPPRQNESDGRMRRRGRRNHLDVELDYHFQGIVTCVGIEECKALPMSDPDVEPLHN